MCAPKCLRSRLFVYLLMGKICKTSTPSSPRRQRNPGESQYVGTDARRRSDRDKDLLSHRTNRLCAKLYLCLRAFQDLCFEDYSPSLSPTKRSSTRQWHVCFGLFSLSLSPTPKGYPQGSGNRRGLYRHYYPVASCIGTTKPYGQPAQHTVIRYMTKLKPS